MKETGLVMADPADYGRTSNYLIIEDTCKKIIDWELTGDEFISTLSWMENLILDNENKGYEREINEEDVSERLTSAKKIYLEGIQTCKEALSELRKYLKARDIVHINTGLSMLLKANRLLIDLQRSAKEKVVLLEESEIFFKQQKLIKRNMASHIFSSFSYGIQPSNKSFTKGIIEHTGNKTEIFSVIPLFDVLTKEEIEKNSGRIKHKKYERGKVLFNDGDNASEIYIIKSGEISLYKTLTDGTINVFAVITAGDIFGEMGIISDSPRSLSASISSEKAELYVISKDDFLYILKTYPEVHLKLSKILCERITENHKRLMEFLSS